MSSTSAGTQSPVPQERLWANQISIQTIPGTVWPMVKQQERQPSHAPFPVIKLRKQEAVLNVAERQSSVALWRLISFGLAVSNRQGGACAVFRRPLECDDVLWKVMSDVSKYHSASTFRVVPAGEGSTVATSHNTWPLFRHSYSCHVLSHWQQ